DASKLFLYFFFEQIKYVVICLSTAFEFDSSVFVAEFAVSEYIFCSFCNVQFGDSSGATILDDASSSDLVPQAFVQSDYTVGGFDFTCSLEQEFGTHQFV